MKAFILSLLVICSGNAFAAGYSNGLVLRQLEKNPAVIGAFKQAQIWTGKKSTCKPLALTQLTIKEDTAHFEVFGRCSAPEMDGQFMIKGIFYSPASEPIIETIEFAYAG